MPKSESPRSISPTTHLVASADLRRKLSDQHWVSLYEHRCAYRDRESDAGATWLVEQWMVPERQRSRDFGNRFVVHTMGRSRRSPPCDHRPTWIRSSRPGNDDAPHDMAGWYRSSFAWRSGSRLTLNLQVMRSHDRSCARTIGAPGWRFRCSSHPSHRAARGISSRQAI